MKYGDIVVYNGVIGKVVTDYDNKDIFKFLPCNYCRSKSDCRSLTIEEQRKYFEEHKDQFAERIRKYNSGQINVR